MARWMDIPSPIVGLSPMDGVTDAAFRFITDTVGHPDVLFTEFVSADGLVRHIPKLIASLRSHPTGTPVVIQLFGRDPQVIAEAALVVRPLNPAGIDINMGCPAKTVTHHGGGAALIKSPEKAIEIVRAVTHAVREAGWDVPVSVKTRIGFGTEAVGEWIPALVSSHPDAITIHGRLFSQGNGGAVDWEAVGRAAGIIRASGIKVFGNGGVRTRHEAVELATRWGLDGILIGQASFGNPWAFTDRTPDPTERIDTAVAHVRAFARLMPDGNPIAIRKHLAWYVSGLPNAAQLRSRLVTVPSLAEAEAELMRIRESLG